MSRTRIFSIKMENQNNTIMNLSSLLGLNAYSIDDTSDCFQNNVNKSLGNGKQYTNNGITTLPDVNNSLLNTLNMIDSTIKTDVFDISLKDENTYTLDDLLDLGNEDLNPTAFFDNSLEDEDIFLSSNMRNQILLETAMASPLSSSSEESCDLDELLFMEKPAISNESDAVQTEVLNDINMLADPVSEDNIFDTIDQSFLEDMLVDNGANMSALCSLLFQSQNVPCPTENVEEVNSSTWNVEEVDSTTFSESSSPGTSEPSSPITSEPSSPVTSEPSSPGTSESESESVRYAVRYAPYKKQKSPEQKQRKKSQNRTAATRYRVKKKDEFKLMSQEADQLETKNKELKGKVDGLKSEIDYLKNLMLDVIKARLAKGTSPENLLSVVMAQ